MKGSHSIGSHLVPLMHGLAPQIGKQGAVRDVLIAKLGCPGVVMIKDFCMDGLVLIHSARSLVQCPSDCSGTCSASAIRRRSIDALSVNDFPAHSELHWQTSYEQKLTTMEEQASWSALISAPCPCTPAMFFQDRACVRACAFMSMYVRECVRACDACVSGCVRACVRACVRGCLCVCVSHLGEAACEGRTCPCKMPHWRQLS